MYLIPYECYVSWVDMCVCVCVFLFLQVQIHKNGQNDLHLKRSEPKIQDCKVGRVLLLHQSII